MDTYGEALILVYYYEHYSDHWFYQIVTGRFIKGKIRKLIRPYLYPTNKLPSALVLPIVLLSRAKYCHSSSPGGLKNLAGLRQCYLRPAFDFLGEPYLFE